MPVAAVLLRFGSPTVPSKPLRFGTGRLRVGLRVGVVGHPTGGIDSSFVTVLLRGIRVRVWQVLGTIAWRSGFVGGARLGRFGVLGLICWSWFRF